MKSVYIIEDGHGRIKVGMASNVSKRITTIKIGCSDGIRKVLVSGELKNAISLEKEAHNYFLPSNTSGEWFLVSIEDVVSFFKLIHGVSFFALPCKAKGGKREGAGRPALPAGKKKVAVNVKLPPDVLAWMDKQGKSRAKQIEVWARVAMGGDNR